MAVAVAVFGVLTRRVWSDAARVAQDGERIRRIDLGVAVGVAVQDRSAGRAASVWAWGSVKSQRLV
jgi:hypothetical protein